MFSSTIHCLHSDCIRFNRISVAVLSVVAVQVKLIFVRVFSIEYGLSDFQCHLKGCTESQTETIQFHERWNQTSSIRRYLHHHESWLCRKNGASGKSESSLSVRWWEDFSHNHWSVVIVRRPCAMVVPDFELIGKCHIVLITILFDGWIAELNLVSAGFTDARLLSRKFVTLYSLCRDLLSKQVSSSHRSMETRLSLLSGTLRLGSACDQIRPGGCWYTATSRSGDERG